MKTWIWPLNWYCRMRELEAEVAKLRRENASLDSTLRAQAISQTGMTSAYIAAISGLMEQRKDWYISGAYMRLQHQRAKEAADAEYKRFMDNFVEKLAKRGDDSNG